MSEPTGPGHTAPAPTQGEDEPVLPDERVVPAEEPDPEEYVVGDVDPEAVLDEPRRPPAAPEDPDDVYPHEQDVEEDRA